jgi:hypothetical protein
MEVLMMVSYDFDVEGSSYDDLVGKAQVRAEVFFGDAPFDLDIRAIEAPNLKDWYQGKATAWEIVPE